MDSIHFLDKETFNLSITEKELEEIRLAKLASAIQLQKDADDAGLDFELYLEHKLKIFMVN